MSWADGCLLEVVVRPSLTVVMLWVQVYAIPCIRFVVNNVHEVSDLKSKIYKIINTVRIPTIMCMCGDYCMFDTISKKQVQNNQLWKHPKVQQFQVIFIEDLEGEIRTYNEW